MAEIGFGDHVRVRRTEDTEALDIAGRIGEVRGYTTPSITGVVGDDGTDYAIAVYQPLLRSNVEVVEASTSTETTKSYKETDREEGNYPRRTV
jgi:hypothetical protein